MNRDQLAARLLATFRAELQEQVAAANAQLLALEREPRDAEALKALFRVVHTLKGAARAAGVPVLESLCHGLESLLAPLRDGARALGARELSTLFAGLDALAAAGENLARDETLTGTPADVLARALAAGELPDTPQQASAADRAPARGAAQAAGQAGAAAPPDTGGGAERGPGSTSASPTAPVRAAERRRAGDASDAVVRVTTERVDALVAAASRLTIEMGRTEGQASSLRTLQDSVARVASELHHEALSAQAPARVPRGHGARPVWQVLREAAQELGRLGQAAESGSRDLRTLATHIAAGARELRMRPFADVLEPMPRIVRDLAAATGKQVRLETSGQTVEADRAVLDELRDALLHLVRNAVDHGIEPPAERLRLGKPPDGVVRIAAELLGDRLLVTVSDDGRGLDAAALHSALAGRGQPAPANDAELTAALFHGGLSTRTDADAISGRGVGLDAVREAIERARGSVDVSWTAGGGTTFRLDAPLTLASIRAVLVGVGGHLAAIPSAFVERLLRAATAELRSIEGRHVILTSGGPVPVVPLARILGAPFVEHGAGELVSAALVHVGDARLAVAVDALLSEEELVVRRITARGPVDLPHVSGAALLASGGVALVLNARSLVIAGLGAYGPLALEPTAAPDRTGRRPRVLVVDDSLTTRALEESLLEAAGYDVTTAVDGADAWRSLQERGADLVVTDVEMPRMDGFELCAAIRGSAGFERLPVVLVTALETTEHRARGLEVGADAYLGKSSFDQEGLLETIRQLIG